jgi:hypothetical protein
MLNTLARRLYGVSDIARDLGGVNPVASMAGSVDELDRAAVGELTCSYMVIQRCVVVAPST